MHIIILILTSYKEFKILKKKYLKHNNNSWMDSWIKKNIKKMKRKNNT